MISFDSFTLKKWLDENAEYMIGARIQKIQQPTRRDFVFSLRNKGETKKLYININPQYYHVAFMSKDNFFVSPLFLKEKTKSLLVGC